eukprot:3675226-Prymnesium_polylepis.1
MAARRRAGGGGQHARRSSRTQARGRHGRATQMHIVSWPTVGMAPTSGPCGSCVGLTRGATA